MIKMGRSNIFELLNDSTVTTIVTNLNDLSGGHYSVTKTKI